MKVHLLALLTLVSGLTAGGRLAHLDSLLTSGLEGSNAHPQLDYLVEGIALATPLVEWGWVGNFYGQGREDRKLAIEAAKSLAITQILSGIIKYGVRRKRPDRHYQPRFWNTRITPSFPSGHAASSAAFAAIATEHYPRSRPLLAVYLAASAYSQVYVGNHYVSDVAAGMLLGWAIGRWMTDPTDESSIMAVPRFSVSVSIPL